MTLSNKIRRHINTPAACIRSALADIQHDRRGEPAEDFLSLVGCILLFALLLPVFLLFTSLAHLLALALDAWQFVAARLWYGLLATALLLTLTLNAIACA